MSDSDYETGYTKPAIPTLYDERPHVCTDRKCGKAFARKSDLVRHLRIHSNERPFVCEWPGCKRDFIQRSALKVHNRVHTGERPHQCVYEGCTKAFSDSSSLARHRRIHTGKRPYKCSSPGCRKDFCRKSTLGKHVKRNHRGEDYELKDAQFDFTASPPPQSRRRSRNDDSDDDWTPGGAVPTRVDRVTRSSRTFQAPMLEAEYSEDELSYDDEGEEEEVEVDSIDAPIARRGDFPSTSRLARSPTAVEYQLSQDDGSSPHRPAESPPVAKYQRDTSYSAHSYSSQPFDEGGVCHCDDALFPHVHAAAESDPRDYDYHYAYAVKEEEVEPQAYYPAQYEEHVEEQHHRQHLSHESTSPYPQPQYYGSPYQPPQQYHASYPSEPEVHAGFRTYSMGGSISRPETSYHSTFDAPIVLHRRASSASAAYAAYEDIKGSGGEERRQYSAEPTVGGFSYGGGGGAGDGAFGAHITMASHSWAPPRSYGSSTFAPRTLGSFGFNNIEGGGSPVLMTA